MFGDRGHHKVKYPQTNGLKSSSAADINKSVSFQSVLKPWGNSKKFHSTGTLKAMNLEMQKKGDAHRSIRHSSRIEKLVQKQLRGTDRVMDEAERDRYNPPIESGQRSAPHGDDMNNKKTTTGVDYSNNSSKDYENSYSNKYITRENTERDRDQHGDDNYRRSTRTEEKPYKYGNSNEKDSDKWSRSSLISRSEDQLAVKSDTGYFDRKEEAKEYYRNNQSGYRKEDVKDHHWNSQSDYGKEDVKDRHWNRQLDYRKDDVKDYNWNNQSDYRKELSRDHYRNSQSDYKKEDANNDHHSKNQLDHRKEEVKDNYPNNHSDSRKSYREHYKSGEIPASNYYEPRSKDVNKPSDGYIGKPVANGFSGDGDSGKKNDSPQIYEKSYRNGYESDSARGKPDKTSRGDSHQYYSDSEARKQESDRYLEEKDYYRKHNEQDSYQQNETKEKYPNNGLERNYKNTAAEYNQHEHRDRNYVSNHRDNEYDHRYIEQKYDRNGESSRGHDYQSNYHEQSNRNRETSCDAEEHGARSHDQPPPIRAPLVTSRSKISTRVDYGKNDKVRELEDAVCSLKELVSEKDHEIESIRKEIQQSRSDSSSTNSGELTRKVDNLIREKENMATEIWKLKKDLEIAKQAEVVEVLHQETPKGPVHSGSDKELVRLKQENEMLRNSRSSRRLLELEEDNRALRLKLGAVTDAPLRDEIHKLQDELRELRQRNHQLLQDNIKLSEHLKQIEDEGPQEGLAELQARCERYRKEREAALDEVEFLRKQLRRSRSTSSLNRELIPTDSHAPQLVKERHNSGSDISDSTAILTSAQITNYDKSQSYEVLSKKPPRPQVSRTENKLTPSQPNSRPAVDDVFNEPDIMTMSSPSKNGSLRSEKLQEHNNSLENKHTSHKKWNFASKLQTSKESSVSLKMAAPRAQVTLKMAAPTAHMNNCLGDEFSDIDESASQVAENLAIVRQLTENRCGSAGSDTTDMVLNTAQSLLSEWSNSEIINSNKVTMRSSGHGQRQRSNVTERSYTKVEETVGDAYEGDIVDNVAPSELSSSLRSVNDRPIVTQHNKHLLCNELSSSLQQRSSSAVKRAFCPRSPADLHIGDYVKFSRQGGKISKGEVKYIGHLPGKSDAYLGVELELEMGKHDGMYDGHRYFQCKNNKGVFVAFSKIVMAWGP